MSLVPKIVLFGALSRAVNRALDRAFWCSPSCPKPCSRSCFFVLSFVPKIALFFVLPVTAIRLLVLIYIYIYIYARVCEGRVLCRIVSAASASFCWIKLLPYALRVFIAQRFLFCFAHFLKRDFSLPRPFRQESKVPVQPPTFQSTGFSAQALLKLQ